MSDFINIAKAKALLKDIYGIKGELFPLPGELDANFRVKTLNKSFILKISRPGDPVEPIKFQYNLLQYLQSHNTLFHFPNYIHTKSGKFYEPVRLVESDNYSYIRLLSWISGITWNDLIHHPDSLIYSLGQKSGELTSLLEDFDSKYAQRHFDWDISSADWVTSHLNLFNDAEKKYIQYFLNGFRKIQDQLEACRKSIIHNDVNDNNIIINFTKNNPEVKSIIDFGDAVHTATINDIAVCLTYVMMNKPDPLKTARVLIAGYCNKFKLKEKEIDILYWLVGARLIISLTKSALNKVLEPNNKYLTISEKPGWKLIKQWIKINPDIAVAHFRNACGMPSHPNKDHFRSFISTNQISVKDIFNLKMETKWQFIDLDISSTTIPNISTYTSPTKLYEKIKGIAADRNCSILISGYADVRPEYLVDDYRIDSNDGKFWKNVLLGMQFWLFDQFEIKPIYAGEVINSNSHSVILKHTLSDKNFFYTIYKNLEVRENIKPGITLEKTDGIGSRMRKSNHPLFFQLSLLNPLYHPAEETCVYNEKQIYEDIYPNPLQIFKEIDSSPQKTKKFDSLIHFRKKHLGKSLSLSYHHPLKIVRGNGVHLIDYTGRKFLDIVNNVAHVGHEHEDVVRAGQDQMAMLNTNSRYLYESLNEFAENLLKTLPKDLSVVHFVNSGSEANELAIRMAKSFTRQKDFIAIEIGYHGNTNACIDISSYKFDGKGGSGAPDTTHIVPLPDTFRGKYTGNDAGPLYASHVEEIIKKLRTKNKKPAAFICESIISCGGQIELPENFLKISYESVRKAGAICIADEVQVGCGRIGEGFWGFETHDVIPDIVTIGKPLGNGHPLAAVVCTQEIAKTFANGMEYFNTFGGNPVSCAIGNEVLKVIKRENLQENAQNIGKYLKEKLLDLKAKYPIIGDVRGKGLFLGIEFTDGNKTPLPATADYIVNRMKDFAILMSTDGPDENVLKIKPPIVFSKNNAHELVTRLEQILGEIENLNSLFQEKLYN